MGTAHRTPVLWGWVRKSFGCLSFLNSRNRLSGALKALVAWIFCLVVEVIQTLKVSASSSDFLEIAYCLWKRKKYVNRLPQFSKGGGGSLRLQRWVFELVSCDSSGLSCSPVWHSKQTVGCCFSRERSEYKSSWWIALSSGPTLVLQGTDIKKMKVLAEAKVAWPSKFMPLWRTQETLWFSGLRAVKGMKSPKRKPFWKTVRAHGSCPYKGGMTATQPSSPFKRGQERPWSNPRRNETQAPFWRSLEFITSKIMGRSQEIVWSRLIMIAKKLPPMGWLQAMEAFQNAGKTVQRISLHKVGQGFHDVLVRGSKVHKGLGAFCSRLQDVSSHAKDTERAEDGLKVNHLYDSFEFFLKWSFEKLSI